MNGWMKGGRDGWIDVWMDGWMDGWIEGRMEQKLGVFHKNAVDRLGNSGRRATCGVNR